MRALSSLCLVAVVLCLASCQPRESASPAPSSHFTMDAIRADAIQWVSAAPSIRGYTAVKPTGSMLPTFGSNALLLIERITGRDLAVGDIAIYEDGNGGHICHRVRAVNERGAAIFAGDNNAGTDSDGWIAADRIRWRVAGVLYASK
jgi:hypothetical protein